eukprot:Tamp_06740.p1 GENE.Tamp_06740~~Tamp_06740.p1  ORF type:complete len:684 (+),score=127.26 Tamp_06740:161-2212(+)
MPLVPHPPSVARPDPGDDQGGPVARLPSGGRPRDMTFAQAQKAGLPTLNFVKLKQEAKGDIELALALGSAGGGTNGGVSQRNTASTVASARARQYSSGGGQGVRQYAAGAQPSGSAQGARPPQAPNTGAAPAPRRMVAGSSGNLGGNGLMPHPPPERHGGQDLPERNKAEPTHPLTARNQDNKGHSQAEAQRHPLTARPAPSEQAHHSQPLVPQKYDEVSKPSPSGGSNVPLTPAAALKLYMAQMTLYEQGEILDYPQVFYVGPNAQKHKPTADAQDNHGFDDERGDYLWSIHDHIAFRYEILGILGKGSFGVVTKCFDWKTNQLVALKIIRNKKRFHHQALVEVKLLEHLRDHDTDGTASIVYMRDYFYFRNHMCITFEILCINLYEFIKNNKFQGLSLGLIRRVAVQLLLSLRFLRKLRVIHCDLKPENILLKAPNKSSIKVIDFGSSCFENERVYTYIQSRFYRSPEVILGLPYDMAIDMWSFGCILAELYTGYPIFPGENEVEQLACIMEVQGLPPRALVEQASRRKMFFESSGAPRIVPNSRGKKRRPGSKDLASALRCNDAAFVSFLDGCLQWDKNHRLTPDQALQHEWITEASMPSSSAGYRRTPDTHSRDSASGSKSARGPPMPANKVGGKPGQPSAAGHMTFRDRHLHFPPIDPSTGVPKSARGAKPSALRQVQ